MRRALPWVGTMAVATAIDLTARFAWEFRLDRVLRTEAVLFLAAGGVFVMLLRRRGRAGGHSQHGHLRAGRSGRGDRLGATQTSRSHRFLR